MYIHGQERPTDIPPTPNIYVCIYMDRSDPQVKLAVPFTLKKQLVDDWEKVTRWVGIWVFFMYIYMYLCIYNILLCILYHHFKKKLTPTFQQASHIATTTGTPTTSCPCPAPPNRLFTHPNNPTEHITLSLCYISPQTRTHTFTHTHTHNTIYIHTHNTI